ncbi:MAG: arylsulfatase [Phycisphaerae bacterium]|nr:arylsulfatase [Phycisphaerae bacterium]
MYNRRNFLKVIAGTSMSLAVSGCQVGKKLSAECRRPNIIYIMADDLGYGDLGCYGQKAIKTPNIDKMAAEGMLFTDHYAGNTVCAPSRCILMTGMHGGHSQVRRNKEFKPMGQMPLKPGTQTVARLLQKGGYKTALIGKWGLGGPDSVGIPQKQGFDYFFGYLCQRHAHNYYPEFIFRNEEMIPLKGNKNSVKTEDGSGIASERAQYVPDLCIDEVMKFIDRNSSKPFFLYYSPTIPHANNEAGIKGMEVPSLGQYADKDWPEPQKGCAAMISRLDQQVGDIIKKLKDLNLDNDTIIMFTSDNGPHGEGGNNPRFNKSSGPLRGFKRDLYDGGIRVPLIVRFPGKVASNTKTGHVSAFWDFLPTACDVAGVKAPSNIDGISYLPTLLGKDKKQVQHDYLYWEFYSKRAARMGNWKAVANSGNGQIELYNLENDIAEANDVAGKYPEITAKMGKIIKEAHVDAPDAD